MSANLKFIDEVRVFVKSGKGGDGACSFRREKYIEFGGPDGGNGGNGGDVFFCADKNINTLIKYKFSPHITAKPGSCGGKNNKTGNSANHVFCYVPIGTQVIDEDNNLLCDIIKDGQIFCAAKGGIGGRGNSTFKSSTDRAPRSYTKGQDGQELTLKLKLKILADIGLVGLPNAGKSMFLSMYSNARPKVADYPFSTLKPNLGVVLANDCDFVIADIPGIIKGAHSGAGLGHRFLRHIERCKALLYLIDINAKDIFDTYNSLKNELALYNAELEKKDHIIILTKCDTCQKDLMIKNKLDLQKKSGKQVICSGLGFQKESILQEIYHMCKKFIHSKVNVVFDPLD